MYDDRLLPRAGSAMRTKGRLAAHNRAFFLSLLMIILTIIVCSSISNPNFLLQKPFAHGTESCIKISTFLKSLAAFIFLLQKGGWSDNSGSAVSQTL